MHLYEELLEPTVVTHSLICKLDPKKSNSHLIVVRGASLLQVYSILPAPTNYAMPKLSSKLLSPDCKLPFALGDRKYLKFEAQWSLNGHLTGINSINQSGKLTVILSFRYAKVVVVEWVPEKKLFKPLSLHFYEKQVVDENFRDLKFPGQLIVEPKNKCLTLWYQQDMFSVLSFPDPEMQMFEDIKMGSIVLKSSNLEPQCRNIVDMKYLHGYNGPTLGVLFQKEPTWTGSLPLKKDSVSYHIISVDIERKSSTTIFSVDKLPYDIQQVIPLHAPIHGSLLVGSNTFIYVESNGRTMAYSVNKYASLGTDYTLIDNSDLNLDLAGSKVAHLSGSTHALIATGDGQLLQLKFALDGLKVFGMQIEKVDGFPCIRNPTSISTDKGTVFIGCNSTSVLLNYKISHTQAPEPQPIDEEFEDVYPQELGPTELQLELCDSLLALGPITCTTVMDGESYEDPSTLCVGFGGEKASGVACLRKGLWTSRSHDTEKFSRMWTAGQYLLGTSASKTYSWLYSTPSFELQSHLKSDVYTLAFALTGTGHYWHIYSTGFDIYDSKWKLITSKTIEKSRSAIISGNHALVCCEDTHDITLYSQRSGKIQTEEIIGRSKRFHLFGEHIVIANNTDIAFCTVHEPSQQDKYNFLNLPDNIKDAAAFSNFDDELKTEITELLVTEIGDDYNKELVLAVIIEDVLTIYSFNQLRKLYTAPKYANLGIFTSKFGGLSTIVAGGSSPFMLVKGHKTPIRIRPIRTNRILCAATIGDDLIFVDSRKRVKSISPDAGWDYVNMDWPVAVTPVGETINCIAYNNTAEVIIIGTNVPHERPPVTEVVGETIMTDENEGEGEEQEQENSEHLPRCTVFKSFLKVINPESLRITDTVEIGEEAVLCMKSINMEIGLNTGQFKEFLVAGTSILLDEDNVSNGHFYVWSVAEIVPQAERPEVRHKVKEVSKELCAGAVTAVYPVMGKLAVAQGQHLFMKAVQEDHTIDPIAFCDLEVFVSDLKCVRNLIFTGDYYRSTCLVNFGDEPNRLDVISKDLEPNEGVVATECVSSELRQDLHAVSSDLEGRLKILQYDPDNVHAMGGPKLVVQSHFYIGAVVNSMSMVYGKHKDLGAIGGTNYGGIVSVMPLNEEEYKSLYVVTQQIMDKEQPFGCLNIRAHLNMNCTGGETLAIHGPTAAKFWGLSRSTQVAYSRKLGRHGLESVFGALTDDPLDYF